MNKHFAPPKNKAAVRAFFHNHILKKKLADRYGFLYRKAGLCNPEGHEFRLWCMEQYCEEMRQEKFIGMVRKLSASCQNYRFQKAERAKFSTASSGIKKRYNIARNKAVTWGLYDDIRKAWLEMHPNKYHKKGMGIQFIHFMESWLRDFEVYHEHDGFMWEIHKEIERLQKLEELELDNFTSAFWVEAKVTEGNKICYENYRKGLGRRQSRRAYRLLMDIYKKYYGDRLVSQDARRRHAQRRRNLKSATKDSKVRTKILAINAGPCKCYWCGTSLPQGGDADHIVPLSKGGSHTCDNIVAACKQCNETKKDIMPNSKDLPIHMELQLPLIHS
jgi:5-methylcytosine-specific restriction endonuclease McrA